MNCEKCIKDYDCKKDKCDGFIEAVEKKIPFTYKGKKYTGYVYNWYGYGDKETYGAVIRKENGRAIFHTGFADGYYTKKDFVNIIKSIEIFREVWEK